MARLYDLFILLDPGLPGERQQEILGNVRSFIEKDGTMVGAHEWGQRRIAFEIDHRPEAEYHIVQFETDSPSVLEQLDHNLKITDGVLRFRIIRLKPGSGPPPQPRPEGPRYREEGRDREQASAPPREAAEAPASEPVAAEAPTPEPVAAEAAAPEPVAAETAAPAPAGGEDAPGQGVADPATA